MFLLPNINNANTVPLHQHIQVAYSYVRRPVTTCPDTILTHANQNDNGQHSWKHITNYGWNDNQQIFLGEYKIQDENTSNVKCFPAYKHITHLLPVPCKNLYMVTLFFQTQPTKADKNTMWQQQQKLLHNIMQHQSTISCFIVFSYFFMPSIYLRMAIYTCHTNDCSCLLKINKGKKNNSPF